MPIEPNEAEKIAAGAAGGVAVLGGVWKFANFLSRLHSRILALESKPECVTVTQCTAKMAGCGRSIELQFTSGQKVFDEIKQNMTLARAEHREDMEALRTEQRENSDALRLEIRELIKAFRDSD